MLHQFQLGANHAPTELDWGFLSLKSIEPLRKPFHYMTLSATEQYARVMLFGTKPNRASLWDIFVDMYRQTGGQPRFSMGSGDRVAFRLAGGKKFEPTMLVPRGVPADWKHDAFQSKRGTQKQITHSFSNSSLAFVLTYALRHTEDILSEPLFAWFNEHLVINPESWCMEPPQERAAPSASASRDTPLSVEAGKEIDDAIQRACVELKLEAKKRSPEAVQQAIYEKLQQLAAGKKLKGDDLKNRAIDLGSLWGQSVCDALGWEWCAVRDGDTEIFSVAAPDRSYFVAPLHFMQKQLGRRGADAEITSLLLFNMLKAGNLPPARAKDYQALG
jgi:hypothetical protein